MKVLFLCKKFPYPLKDGESIAVSNLCKELKAQGCDITLLCMNTSKHYVDPEALPQGYNYFSRIYTVNINNTLSPWKAMASLFSGASYHIKRFTSDRFRNKLTEILQQEEFDIIQLETLYLAPYVDTIRKYSNARIVMRAHNVEHEIWERITHNTSRLHIRKWYLNHLTRKLREYEIDQFSAYDHLVTLTERDLEKFKEKGYANGASVAPIGFDPGKYPYSTPRFNDSMSLCFIGSLDWRPNLEGLNWFLHHCWPLINKKWPHLTFHIAGRNTPMSLLQMKLPNVTVHGEISDAVEFISRHSIMVVPLFSGSGMRVKIVEGMVMGKVIVTTSVGREGIEGKNKEHLITANAASEFIDAIDYCIAHPQEAVRMGQKAIEKASSQFNSQSAGRQVMDIYQKLLTYNEETPELSVTGALQEKNSNGITTFSV